MEISDANKLTQKYEKDWNQHRCLLSGERIPNKLTQAKFGLRTRYQMRPIFAGAYQFCGHFTAELDSEGRHFHYTSVQRVSCDLRNKTPLIQYHHGFGPPPVLVKKSLRWGIVRRGVTTENYFGDGEH